MTITRISKQRLYITDERLFDGPQLGINTGVPHGGFAAQKLSALARRGGIVVRDGRTVAWNVSRVIPYEGRLFLVGEWLAGETIEEWLATNGGDVRWLTSVLDALVHTAEYESHTIGNTALTIVDTDGGVLLLDGRLCEEINRYLPLDRRLQVLLPYQRSVDRGINRSVYFAAALTWQVVTGTPLCTGTTEEETDDCHAQTGVTARVHRLVPEAPIELADLLYLTLVDADERTPDRLSALAHVVREKGLRDEPSEDERERRLSAALESHRRATRSSSIRTFFRKRGSTVALAVLAAIFIGIIPFQLIRGWLTPPATVGLRPAEVVSTFYEAWSDLDHILMEETLARKVGRDLVREVTNIYVIDRVQYAHMMESNIMPADEWLSAGRPEGRLPYGPTDLTITVIRQSETEALVAAEYDLWRPDSDRDELPRDEQETPRRPRILRSKRRDRIGLKPTRWGWEIVEIRTTLLSEPTPYDPN